MRLILIFCNTYIGAENSLVIENHTGIVGGFHRSEIVAACPYH